MKKLFLVILAGGLLFTACKKEEKEMPTQTTNQHSWKTSDWVMKKKSVIVEGTLCDEYMNQLTGQVVYEAMEDSKDISYTRFEMLVLDGGFLRLTCLLGGSTCAKATIDGVPVWIIKRGQQTY